MKKLLLFVSLLVLPHFTEAQQTAVGIFYTAIPFSGTITRENTHLINLSVNEQLNEKWTGQLFVYYGANRYKIKEISEWSMPYGIAGFGSGEQLPVAFSAHQFGAGLGIGYRLFEFEKLIISPGTNCIVNWWSKAEAEKSTVVYDTLNGFYRLTPNTVHDENYGGLNDVKPDLVAVNFTTRFQYKAAQQVGVFAEPFLTVYSYGKIPITSGWLVEPGINVGIQFEIPKRN